jgi:hypothetical protein
MALALLLAPPPSAVADLLSRWDSLEKGVRDGTRGKDEARAELTALLPLMRQRFPIEETPWVLPAEGGSIRWIGGKRGEGFHPATPRPAYSWYDGNRHGGHPGHDVFIPDRDGNCRDDRTRQPFFAVTMQPMAVLSVNEEWKPGEPRGGKYVWAYNASLDMFFYYAHLDTILVKPGDVLRPGGRLGTIGRTGFRKGAERKACHIHLMVLRAAQGNMVPYDFFPSLLTARRTRIDWLPRVFRAGLRCATPFCLSWACLRCRARRRRTTPPAHSTRR